MAKNSEPNAQNSELNPKAHPSGARIENMMQNAASERNRRREVTADIDDETSNERAFETNDTPHDSRYSPPQMPAEGDRDVVTEDPTAPANPSPHRMDSNNREER